MAGTTANPTRRVAASIQILAILFVVAAIAGPRLWPLPNESGIHAAPFYGHWRLHDVSRLAPAMAVAVVIITLWPRIIQRANGHLIALWTGTAATGWALALAFTGGSERWHSTLNGKQGYASVAQDIDSPRHFIAGFLSNVDRYSIHVKGHPPLMPIVLWGLRVSDLGSSQWTATLILATWGFGIAAVIVTVRHLGGDEVARRASGAVAFIPAAVWAATTPDAMFAGVAAIAISLMVVASGRRTIAGDLLALGGGALFAIGLHLTYGLAPLIAVPAVVLLARRQVRTALFAALGLIAVFATFRHLDFWWSDGLRTTRGFYEIGIAARRPYSYFVLLGNPAAALVAVGPLTIAGFSFMVSRAVGNLRSMQQPVAAMIRESRATLSRYLDGSLAMLLPVGALGAIVAADLSGLSKAEVERIWLIFYPWLAVFGTISWRAGTQRMWLAVQLGIGLVLQVALVTPW